MGNRISLKLPAFSGPVSLGDLCQAMFIEGARALGYAEEPFVPTEVQEQIFLAAVMIADGVGLLLQLQQSRACT